MAINIKRVPLGIMVNPRSGSMLYTGMFGGVLTSSRMYRTDVDSARPNVGVFSLRSDEILASGYFDTGGYPLSFKATGYPRVHSLPGVISRDSRDYGIGSALYYGMAHAAEMIRIQRVTPAGVEIDHPTGGISSTNEDSTRSDEASAWWDNAVFRHRVATRSVEKARLEVDFDMPRSRSEKDIDATIKLKTARMLDLRVTRIDDDGEPRIDPTLARKVFENIRIDAVDEESERADVTVSGIEVDVLKYPAIKKFVLASIIPSTKLARSKKFESMQDVPLEWISVNKESMLAANVAELRELKSFGKELFEAIVSSMRRAKATDSEIEELTQRYARMVDAVVEPAAGARFVMASGTLRPSKCTVCVAKHRAAGAVTDEDRALANKLAVRRIKLGWDAY